MARCPRGVLEKGRQQACDLESLLLMLILLRRRLGRRDGRSGGSDEELRCRERSSREESMAGERA